MIYSGAQDDVINHHSSIFPMGPDKTFLWNLTAAGGDLALRLFPKEHMSWQIWGLVLPGLKQFMMDFEYVELEFDVLYGPVGTIALGTIAHGTIEFTMDAGG